MAEKKLPRGLRNNEEWRDIPGYEGLYQVSSIGNVFSYLSGRCIKSHKHKKGYLEYRLNKCGKQRTFKAHRLVALSFIPEVLGKYEVDHINGIKDDNRVVNLRWCTGKENINFPIAKEKYLNAIKNRLEEERVAIGKKISNSLLGNQYSSKKVVVSNGHERIVFRSAKSAARYLNVAASLVSMVCRGIGRNKTAAGCLCTYLI